MKVKYESELCKTLALLSEKSIAYLDALARKHHHQGDTVRQEIHALTVRITELNTSLDELSAQKGN